MKVIYNTLIMAFALLSVGCASIVSKSSYPVTFDSNPPEADILIVDKKGTQIYKGKAPHHLILPASAGYFSGSRFEVTANKDGFYETTRTLQADVDGWYLGNLLSWGALGLLIDPASGAMWKLDDRFTINLKAKETSTPPAPASQP